MAALGTVGAGWGPGAAAKARAATPSTCPSDSGLTITCGVVYNTGDGMTLDAYQPTARLGSALPAVILIHGGGWAKGGSQGDLVPIAEQMASSGLVTFSVNYTLDTNGTSYPQAVDDVQAAVNFLHANSSVSGEWNISASHIGTLGTSAGANLAGMLATCTAQGSLCDAPQVQAAVLWSAPLNLTTMGCASASGCAAGSPGATIATYLGCYSQQCPGTYEDASPANWATAGAAPTLLFNSDNEAIPANQLSGMVQELHADCANYRFALLPGNQHAETYEEIVLNTTITFLLQQLVTSPPKLGCSTSPPWTDAASAFDPAEGGSSGEAVAFGGCCNPAGTLLNTTRVLTSGSWVVQHPATSPPARIGAAMAWDQATGQLILFGGETDTGDYNTALNDTWAWNGTTWTNLKPSGTLPQARSEASLAYDSTTKQLVLFGGETPLTASAHSEALGDTWTWNGSEWSQVTPSTSPPPLYGAAMTIDPGNGHPILFGGDNATANCDVGCLALQNQTWEWTGATWQLQSPAASPSVREFASLAATPGASSGSLVLFGGLNGVNGVTNSSPNTESLQGDTWTWQGGNWVQQSPGASPPALYGATMPESPIAGDYAVLTGGYTGSDTGSLTTYGWTGSNWVANP
jgi:acetyl esterase/lipase